MAIKKRFESRDIGAELLSIITKGLYRDPLDTLREYVQNSIDAAARHIEIKASRDLVSIRDDGNGMTRDIAEGAIRLGISEKNPNHDVGFRGIGVYSSYNICERLEIYTRPESGTSSKIIFDFKKIRKYLSKEEERRMTGEPAELYLEKLLGNSVWLEDCEEPCPLAANGTLVLMIGIRGEVYKRLTSWWIVTEYLESVVPLPFHPDFSFKDDIEKRFRAEDYRVVDLELTIGERTQKIYRPYKDVIFDHGRGFGPKYFDIVNILAKGNLGFAWVCLNDARKYLSAKKLRGLLIKKFDFSVGGREYFSTFFSRGVFNNRITGEIIITHPDLLPNAARSGFEPGPIRDSLHMSLTELSGKISSWANKIQEELKAREELETISPQVFKIVQDIPSSERDVPHLLKLNNTLTSYESRLNTHKRNLLNIDKVLFDRTLSALQQAKQTITEILSQKERASGRRKRISQAKRVATKAPDTEELKYAQDKPKDLLDLLNILDMQISPHMHILLEYIDKEILQGKLVENDYSGFLDELQTYLEENM